MKSEIFYAPELIAASELEEFIAHYHKVYGEELSFEEISEKIYGGQPLNKHFSHVEITASKQELQAIRGTIRLIASDPQKNDLVIEGVSFKQFLVAGLPYNQCGSENGCSIESDWDGKDHWDTLHQQYRLELCHSEISRWSIFFKKDGKLAQGLKDNQVSGDEGIDSIELINNCTTSKGFEFRLTYQVGAKYHGSFGSDSGLADIYREFSQWQAGSLAYQGKNLAKKNSPPSFGFGEAKKNIYYNFSGWTGQATHSVSATVGLKENTIKIYLDRYLQGAKFLNHPRLNTKVKVKRGKIRYDRWGKKGVEYYEKPKKRGLVLGVKKLGLPESVEIPKTYDEVYSATEITLPNFQPSGIYDIADRQIKRGYPCLSEFKNCVVSKLSNGRYWLELHRIGCDKSFELRRIVFGNLDLKSIPKYQPKFPEKSFWTLHRFGYGARDTTQEYQKAFLLPHGKKKPAHFAYLLAGQWEDPSQADYYVCPEPFGIERAIFTWEAKNVLVIDLISFERILPVWQGKIKFPEKFFK